jgi:hypothetical protein
LQAWSTRAAQQKDRRNGKKRARQDDDESQDFFAGWGASTTLAKLHALAVYIRVSTIHHDEWIQIIGRDIGIDNATRWNSWYCVIDIALKKKTEVLAFLSKYHSELPSAFTDEDWDILWQTHTFLKPFWQATLGGERSNSGLAFSLSTMDELLLWMEKQKVCNPPISGPF